MSALYFSLLVGLAQAVTPTPALSGTNFVTSWDDLWRSLGGLAILALGAAVLWLRGRVQTWITATLAAQKIATTASTTATQATQAVATVATNAEIKTAAAVEKAETAATHASGAYDLLKEQAGLVSQLIEGHKTQVADYLQTIARQAAQLDARDREMEEFRLRLIKAEEDFRLRLGNTEQELERVKKHCDEQDDLIARFSEWGRSVIEVISKYPNGDQIKKLLPPMPRVKSPRRKGYPSEPA